MSSESHSLADNKRLPTIYKQEMHKHVSMVYLEPMVLFDLW